MVHYLIMFVGILNINGAVHWNFISAILIGVPGMYINSDQKQKVLALFVRTLSRLCYKIFRTCSEVEKYL